LFVHRLLNLDKIFVRIFVDLLTSDHINNLIYIHIFPKI